MKKLVSISVFLLLALSWKASGQIITSKEEAVEKGLYSYSEVPGSLDITSGGSGSQSSETEEKSKKKRKRRSKKNESVNIPATEPVSVTKTEIKLDENDYGFVSDFTIDNYTQIQIVNNAMDFEGVRYRTGGTTKDGMDCSGLVFTTFKIFDISLPRSSYEQAKVGEEIKISEVKPGDLLFFKTNRRKKAINHVGLVISVENGEVQFIHSTLSLGVTISSMSEEYYTKSFAQANRILN
ncbi:NlpC/P60 family protein [Flavobacterium rakeshii]|uniref:NlpC/P60 family protein n=1 Tax=Flavobacterium rakeshii TaxID=1038845 RepID=A0A6N8H7S5_9FLAO|nr:NlpC/P60 family protein [Flavobacterium rakeshii]MUV02664.1 NlpC/P60 family protein [Flavobacterium rakeshii]